jgi:hypothetical protein
LVETPPVGLLLGPDGASPHSSNNCRVIALNLFFESASAFEIVANAVSAVNIIAQAGLGLGRTAIGPNANAAAILAVYRAAKLLLFLPAQN